MFQGMTMEIRKATMDDLAAISELEAVCFPPAEAATRESFEKRLQVFADCFWLFLVMKSWSE